jgi:hypothetical protein
MDAGPLEKSELSRTKHGEEQWAHGPEFREELTSALGICDAFEFMPVTQITARGYLVI